MIRHFRSQLPVVLMALILPFMFWACDNPCEGVKCNRKGTCKWTNDKTPYCVCNSGYYRPEDIPTACYPKYTGPTYSCKPVIYLYPTEVMDVRVRFSDPQSVELVYTYPEYPEDGWHVMAHPDGTLENIHTGRQYYVLFWEGPIAFLPVIEEGFVVADHEIIPFLEEKLEQLGLNDTEANEFIIYWLPILAQSPYQFIQFLVEPYQSSVPLDVDPPPDTVIRFLMQYQPLQQPPATAPAPQTFPVIRREGFVLVEWGGQVRVTPEDTTWPPF